MLAPVVVAVALGELWVAVADDGGLGCELGAAVAVADDGRLGCELGRAVVEGISLGCIAGLSGRSSASVTSTSTASAAPAMGAMARRGTPKCGRGVVGVEPAACWVFIGCSSCGFTTRASGHVGSSSSEEGEGA